jgi:hypothetical protein
VTLREAGALTLVPRRTTDEALAAMAKGYQEWVAAGGLKVGPDPFEVMVAETERLMVAEDREAARAVPLRAVA